MKDRAVKIYSWLYYYGSLFRAIQYAQYLCAYHIKEIIKKSNQIFTGYFHYYEIIDKSRSI